MDVINDFPPTFNRQPGNAANPLGGTIIVVSCHIFPVIDPKIYHEFRNFA
jgi:hypothetical protein